MLAYLPGRGRVIDGGVVVQQQRQLGAGDLELGGAVLADEPLAVRHLLRREGRLVGRGWTGHRAPPSRQPRRSGRLAANCNGSQPILTRYCETHH